MIELFRNWINILLCLGIFTVLVQLIVPKNKMRKYIYSLLGVVTVIAIISPVINVLKNPEMENGIQQVLSNLDNSDTNIPQPSAQETKNAQQEAVKNSFIASIKTDVKNKLKEKGVTVNRVEIFMNENYDIEKLEIHIAKLKGDATVNTVTGVVKYINEQYDISYSKIEVTEEGES